MTVRILVAEDDPDVADVIVRALTQAGFEVDLVTNGTVALQSARERPYDLVLLDWILPGESGIAVCRSLRAESDVPIVMLTGRDAELDRVLGLELGADDYVTKPFSAQELVSRVRAHLRRRALDRDAAEGAVLVAGGIRIDLSSLEVVVDGRPVLLTPSELRLLTLLARNVGRTLSRDEIVEHLWGSKHVGDARAADGHVVGLRRKIERDPDRPERILTVRSVGYRLVSV